MDSTINQSASVQDNAAHTTQPEGSEAAGNGTAASPQPQNDPQYRIAAAKKRRRMVRQRRATHNVILAGAFLLILLLFFLINLFVRDRDFSDAENRKLAQKPQLTTASLLDGSYFSDLTSYTADQFFGRDRWMSMKLKAETLMGRKDASGIYLGKDDYLLGAPETPDPEALSRTIGRINSFATTHSDLSMRMLLVPDAAMILSDKLPKNAPVRDQLADMDAASAQLSGSVQFISAADALSSHSDEYIYYKTDHHWTSLGAYYTFTAAAGQLGIATPVSNYDTYTVTDSFEGTLSSKSGSHRTKDSIDIYQPKSDVTYYVTYADSTQRICSLYHSECLNVKDKYTVFFGGNHPKVEISTTANNERVLLLFKDSYANSFVQFLTPYYQKIIMIDPRYYYDSLDSILTSEGVTDVLFLYSADTFLRDTALADVLETADTQAAVPADTESSDPVHSESSVQEPAVLDSTAESSVTEPTAE